MSFEDMMKEPRDENQAAIVMRSEYNDEGTWESVQPDIEEIQEPIEHKEVDKSVKTIGYVFSATNKENLRNLFNNIVLLDEINYGNETHSKDAERFNRIPSNKTILNIVHPDNECYINRLKEIYTKPLLLHGDWHIKEPCNYDENCSENKHSIDFLKELLNNSPDIIPCHTVPEPPPLPMPQLCDLFTGVPHISNNKNIKDSDLEKEMSVKEIVINELKQILSDTEDQCEECLSNNVKVLKNKVFKLNYIEAQLNFLIEKLRQ